MHTHDWWIGVDLDGTLAEYNESNEWRIGKPIEKMVKFVKDLIASGETVKIVTARVNSKLNENTIMEEKILIAAWCAEHLGEVLEVTSEKDYNMKWLYDDRAVTVEFNTGVIL